jgi:hypothetical protein
MTTALEGGEWSIARPGRTLPRERAGIGGWVDPRAGLERCRKSRPHRYSIPDRPARSQSLYWLSYPAHSVSSSGWKISYFNCTVVCNFENMDFQVKRKHKFEKCNSWKDYSPTQPKLVIFGYIKCCNFLSYWHTDVMPINKHPGITCTHELKFATKKSIRSQK